MIERILIYMRFFSYFGFLIRNHIWRQEFIIHWLFVKTKLFKTYQYIRKYDKKNYGTVFKLRESFRATLKLRSGIFTASTITKYYFSYVSIGIKVFFRTYVQVQGQVYFWKGKLKYNYIFSSTSENFLLVVLVLIRALMWISNHFITTNQEIISRYEILPFQQIDNYYPYISKQANCLNCSFNWQRSSKTVTYSSKQKRFPFLYK